MIAGSPVAGDVSVRIVLPVRAVVVLACLAVIAMAVVVLIVGVLLIGLDPYARAPEGPPDDRGRWHGRLRPRFPGPDRSARGAS